MYILIAYTPLVSFIFKFTKQHSQVNMASSQETFSKKEREKKRLKKKKDKVEKKEERQANAQKGQSLEDMMVYVDENGNLTSTPPDPRKRKQSIVKIFSWGS